MGKVFEGLVSGLDDMGWNVPDIINQTLHYKVAIQALLSRVCFPFLRFLKFVVVVLDRVFSIGRQKKVFTDRVGQVVVLYSNNGVGSGLDRLSIGSLR